MAAQSTTAPPNLLTAYERTLLSSIPDAEQRSVAHRDILESKGIEPTVRLDIAENILLYDLLKNNVFDKLKDFPESALRYISAYGSEELRKEIADRLGKSFGAHVDPKNVFGTAGVSSSLECIATALRHSGVLQQGDTVLLPAPFWQGFKWSFQQRPGLRCVPAQLEKAGAGKFTLTLDDLKSAYEAASPKPKLLVLTNPNNPLGVNYDKPLLESVYAWALGKGMHVISDEIYRHSQVDGAVPGFVSALALEATTTAPDRVHVVWGFGKDFGLSGLRTGFIISRSAYVHRTMMGSNVPGKEQKSLAWFTPFDSLKNFVILELLKATVGTQKTPFWDEAMTQYRQRITESFNTVTAVLEKYGVRYVRTQKANPAQFLWLDLREFLPEKAGQNTWPVGAWDFDRLLPGTEGVDPKEAELQCRILRRTGVHLLPGGELSCAWPGYFRLCYTAYGKDTVAAAVERVCKELRPGGGPGGGTS